MKTLCLVPFLLALCVRLSAQTAEDTRTAVVPEPAVITGTLVDGTPPKPAPPKPEPDFKVLSSRSKTVVREEPAPLAGMVPVRKPVTLTKLLIEREELPAPPEPLPPLDISDPAVASRLAAMRAKFRKTEIVFVSATVHDHRATFVRWWPNGKPESEMNAWVNIDFNLFCGFGTYEWGDRRFALVMGIGNESSAARRKLAERLGKTYIAREVPALPADAPGYMLTKGNADAGAMDTLSGLLDLYRAEEPRLSAAYAGREAARIAREAELRRNPPQPKDVTTWISKPKRMDQPGK